MKRHTLSSLSERSIYGLLLLAALVMMVPGSDCHAEDGGSAKKAVKAASEKSSDGAESRAIVNIPPWIAVDAFVVPNPTAAGQDTEFNVHAIDLDADPLTYTWDFGDGMAGTGNPATHAYSSAGIYTAVVTVSDGTDSVQSAVEVVVGDPFPRPIERLRIRMFFTKEFGDRIIFRVHLPLPAGFDPIGLPIAVNFGGVKSEAIFTFNGGALNVEGPFRARYKLYKRQFPDGTRLLRVILWKGRFVETLEDEGLKNADLDDTPMNVQCTIFFNGQTLSGNYAGTYRSRENRVGKLR